MSNFQSSKRFIKRRKSTYILCYQCKYSQSHQTLYNIIARRQSLKQCALWLPHEKKKQDQRTHAMFNFKATLSLSVLPSYRTTPIPPADLPHWSPPKNNAAKTNRAAHTIYLRSNDRAKFKIKLKTPLSLALFGMEKGGGNIVAASNTHTQYTRNTKIAFTIWCEVPFRSHLGDNTVDGQPKKKPQTDFRKAKVRRSGDWIAQRGLSYPSGTA